MTRCSDSTTRRSDVGGERCAKIGASMRSDGSNLWSRREQYFWMGREYFCSYGNYKIELRRKKKKYIKGVPHVNRMIARGAYKAEKY